MFLKGQGVTIVCIRISGNGFFHLLYRPVNIFQIGTFGHINVDIGGLRVNGRKKFHGFFNADAQHPDLPQKDKQGKGGDEHREFMVQGMDKDSLIGFKDDALDLNGLFPLGFDLSCGQVLFDAARTLLIANFL